MYRFLVSFFAIAMCSASFSKEKHSFPLLRDAFTAGFTMQAMGQDLAFRQQRIGRLHVTSGQIVGCEPFAFYEAKPFEYDFPKGDFDVVAAIVGFTYENGQKDERIAMVKVVFKDVPVDHWIDCAFGYAVDGGCGALADHDFAVLRKKEGPQGVEAWNARVSKALAGRLFAQIDDAGSRAVLFSTGFGDGRYFSLVGYDREGSLVALLTNFRILPLKD